MLSKTQLNPTELSIIKPNPTQLSLPYQNQTQLNPTERKMLNTTQPTSSKPN